MISVFELCETAVNSSLTELGRGGCRRSSWKQRGAKAFDGEIVDVVSGAGVVVERDVAEKLVAGVDKVRSVEDVAGAAISWIFYSFVVATRCFGLRWNVEADAAYARTVYRNVANSDDSVDCDS